MPIYEYRCEACGYKLEAIQKISDDPLIVCPECGQPALKKLVSAAGFRLKGSGWYETDFKSGRKKNLHEAGKKPEAQKKTASAKKVDTGKKKGGAKTASASERSAS